MKSPLNPTEHDIQTAVMQLLSARGFRVFRRNTGAMKSSYTTKDGVTKNRFVRFSEPGMADMYGWKVACRDFPAVHLEVEVKRPGKKPSATQEEWLRNSILNGCVAFWCDSVKMCDEKLRDFGY